MFEFVTPKIQIIQTEYLFVYFFFPIFSISSPRASGSAALGLRAGADEFFVWLVWPEFGLALLRSPKFSPIPRESDVCLTDVDEPLLAAPPTAVFLYPGLLSGDTITFPLELTLERSFGAFDVVEVEVGFDTPTGPLGLTDVGPPSLPVGGNLVVDCGVFCVILLFAPCAGAAGFEGGGGFLADTGGAFEAGAVEGKAFLGACEDGRAFFAVCVDGADVFTAVFFCVVVVGPSADIDLLMLSP